MSVKRKKQKVKNKYFKDNGKLMIKRKTIEKNEKKNCKRSHRVLLV